MHSSSFIIHPRLSLSILVFHYPSSSFIIHPRLSLSILVFHYPSSSFIIHPRLSLSILVFQYPSSSFNIHPCLSLSILVFHYPSLSFNIHPRLSLFIPVRLNKDKNRTISDLNWLPQPIVLSYSVETFKAAVSSIKCYFLKPVCNFSLFQLSCTTCEIIFIL